MKRPYISIVIPVLNEEANLKRLLPQIRKLLSGMPYEMIVVDGGSSDRSVTIAERYGCRIFHESIGKGNALKLGFRKARGRYVVMMDADLSHRPAELLLMLDALKIGYDAVFGSRFILGGGTADMPWYRKFGNWVFVQLVNLLFGSGFSDLCYGYKAFRRQSLKKLRLAEDGFGIETEMAIESVRHGLKIMEIPSYEKKRWKGHAKLSTFRDGWAILRVIVKKLFS